MKVPLTWLRAYCDPGLSPQELGETLAMHSIELERISHLGPPSDEGYVVGRVIAAERHPNADRLRVCQVDAGDGPRTIVCGAANVAGGQTVAVALPGAVLADGTKLGKARLRGVESDGMILSEAELGIGDDHSGILVLDGGADAQPGSPLSSVLAVPEQVLELEPTSNRVDCFCVYGVAREVHAVTGAGLATAPWEEDAEPTGEGEASDYASVTVEVPELCPRFTARVFTDVRIGPSPPWLKARLTAAGMRPINNVVDITNYVMLLTAQPSHAFDLDRVRGGELIVRTAAEGERMRTLDGTERVFDPQAVLVCDRDGPTGIAGIMGGQVSEVSETTTRVLLEVATWNGVNILRTSRKLGLRTDASNRFEKQLHPELALRAQRVASQLIVELCGARLMRGTIDVAAELPERHLVTLRGDRTQRLLGMEIGSRQSAEYLRRLEFDVESAGEEKLVARVPVHRHYDVTREADLIEEVGRIHGYAAHLPAALPAEAVQAGTLSREQRLRRRAEDVVRDLGFDTVITLTLVDPGLPQRLRIDAGDPRAEPIAISNPLSGEHSVLRTTLLGGLLDVARYNRAHGAEHIAVAESGRAYLRAGAPAGGPLGGEFAGDRAAPAYEPWRLACLAAGSLAPGHWRTAREDADFYAIKGVMEAVCAQLDCEVAVEGAAEPFLRAGRAARILIGDAPAGWIGELHPLVCRAWDLDAAAGFEFDLAPIAARSGLGHEQYTEVIGFPPVHQDIAVVVPEDVEAARVQAAVAAGGGELLCAAEVFDVYRGEQVGTGRKSLALRLTFQAPDRTLTDGEVAELREAIRAEIATIGGSLRE